MTSYPVVCCDNCGIVVKEREAHGWFQLRTVITYPSPEQYEQLQSQYGDQLSRLAPGLTAGRPTPARVGGEFCSTLCLSEYVTSADLITQLSTEHRPDTHEKQASDADVMDAFKALLQTGHEDDDPDDEVFPPLGPGEDGPLED